jgi:orotidine-5'-phosphate decarboxylase
MTEKTAAPVKAHIPPRERLIFALDVPDLDHARRLIDTLGDAVVFYKLGLEFFLSGHYFELAAQLQASGKKIFADLKLFDIPATVAAAVRQLASRQVNFCTVHGNDGMLRAAADAKGDMQILAVTALTSLDQGDLDDLGFQCDAKTLVLSRARRALAAGCDGVVSSGLEVSALRESVDHALIAAARHDAWASHRRRCGLPGGRPPHPGRGRPTRCGRGHPGRNQKGLHILISCITIRP